MITRLVKMTFREEKVSEFLTLYNNSRERIAGFDGCIKVSLFQDINHPAIFFTYSEWLSEAHLDIYRKSEIFLTIWKKAKACFASPAEAWSLNDTFKNF
jgi:quinol monooxygenase YgiN